MNIISEVRHISSTIKRTSSREKYYVESEFLGYLYLVDCNRDPSYSM